MTALARVGLFGILLVVWSSILLAANMENLEFVATHRLPEGTHRPEILVTDSGELVLVVVKPEGKRGVGQVKHLVYRFTRDWQPIGEPFVVTRHTQEYGEPADHRAAIIHSELVVIYQTLNIPEDTRPKGGPMEQYARDQSLILARFRFDGSEVLRQPIVAHAADRTEDNFPDHCLLWRKDRLFVSTGAHRTLKIREVDLDANILATHVLPTSTTLPGEIGNSLLYDGQDLYMFSSGAPHKRASLTVTRLSEDFQTADGKELYDPAFRQSFPTSALLDGHNIFIAHISQDRTGPIDFERNPYFPTLKILDKDFNVLAEWKIGDEGFSHVHPTLVRIEDRLFVAWSKRVTMKGRVAPQVWVEEFMIQ